MTPIISPRRTRTRHTQSEPACADTRHRPTSYHHTTTHRPAALHQRSAGARVHMPQTNIISPDAQQITTNHTPAAPHEREAGARVHMPQTNIISPDAPQITTKHTPAAPHQRKARARVHAPHRPISYHHDAQARGTRKATLRVPTRLIVPYHITTPRRTRPRHYINAKQARASTCLIDPHHITTTHRHAAHAKRDCVCRHASSTHIGSPQHDAQVQGTTSTQNRRARPHAS